MKAFNENVLTVIVALLACVTIGYGIVQAQKNTMACTMLEQQAFCQLVAGYPGTSLVL